MKKLLALTLLALPAVALAGSDSPDHTFYQKAAAGGMAEVEAGKLAQDKASSDAVKKFGAMMVKDHTAANDKLKSIAADKGIILPTTLDPKHQAMKQQLQAQSGPAFDHAYVQGQIRDHQDTIALMEKEAASGKDPQAKAFATQTLPTVKAHLDMLQKMPAASAPQPQSESQAQLQ